MRQQLVTEPFIPGEHCNYCGRSRKEARTEPCPGPSSYTARTRRWRHDYCIVRKDDACTELSDAERQGIRKLHSRCDTSTCQDNHCLGHGSARVPWRCPDIRALDRLEELEAEQDAWKESEGVVRGWLQRTIEQRDAVTLAGSAMARVLEGLHPSIRPDNWRRALAGFRKATQFLAQSKKA